MVALLEEDLFFVTSSEWLIRRLSTAKADYQSFTSSFAAGIEFTKKTF